MNYRHAYHAGNFADVFKHAILSRVIEYLKRKEAAFRVIDTHAGAGLYELSSTQAAKTGEWMTGIGALLAADLPQAARELLEPYLAIVRGFVTDGQPTAYPGSPMIARALLRRQDRLSAYELHPEEHAALARQFAGDFQARASLLDGWLVPGAHLPPKEKRGLVLIDPPFEAEGEFERIADALDKGHRRWPGGTFLAWYPLKDARTVERFAAGLAQAGLPDLVRIEMTTGGSSTGLWGCGMAVKNAPFTLEAELSAFMPALTSALSRGAGATWRWQRLSGE